VRAVLDPNVLVSALLSRSGAPAQIVARWLRGEFELVLSELLLAELGRALALDPKVLLLDEPMGGCNREEKEDMARFILDVNEEWGVTVILIEHDMGVVMDISDRVAVLDMGQKIAEGTPDEVRANAAVIKAYLGDPKGTAKEARRG